MLQTLLQKRSNGYYYFRWVCPPPVRQLIGKREIIKSLRTTSKLQALARAGYLYALVDRLKSSGDVKFLKESSVINMDEKQDLLSEIKANQEKLNKYFSTEQAQSVTEQLNQEMLEPVPLELFDQIDITALSECRMAQKYIVSMLFHEHFQRVLASAVHGAAQFLPENRTYAIVWERVSSKLLEMYEASKTNRLGEYEDGKTIRQFIENELDFFSSLSGWRFAPLVGAISIEPDLYARALKDLEEALHTSIEVVHGKFKKENLRPDFSLLSPKEISNVKTSTQPPQPKAKVLSAVYEEFLDHKIKVARLSATNQKEYRVYFESVLHFVGDKPINSITKRMIKDCLERYAALPRRTMKPYIGLPVERLVELEIPKEHRVASKTVGNVRKLLQGIFRFAVDQDYISESPAKDMNLAPEKVNYRGAFNQAQLRDLLALSEPFQGKDEWKRWVLRLAIFTGARAGEITQIRRKDILQDEDSGIHYLLITPDAGNLKTENAFRRVPLHSELLKMGFLEFAELRSDRLFPAIATSKVITRWFPTFRAAANIPTHTDLKEKLVFHSFRHSFITRLRGAGASDVQVQQIVGHEKTGAGVTDRYTQRFALDNLKSVIELFRL